MMESAFFILFLLFLPWLIMRGLMFNARYSSYRNLHFAFDKNLGGAYKTFLGVGLLTLITIGLMYPYFMHAIQSYRIDHHSFGQLYFRLKSSVTAFYKFYLIGIGILAIGLFAIIFIFQGALLSMQAIINADPNSDPGVSPTFAGTMILIMFLFALVYLFVYAYIRAKIFNVVWSNTALNKRSAHTMTASTIPLVAFKGTLNPGKLFGIYLTNTFAIVLSIGLLIPWAKVRLAKYRIEQLEISSIADLKTITKVEREKVGTIGSEMGDILDIDIGL